MTQASWVIIGGICTVILAFVGVYSVSQVARGQARAQAAELADDKEKIRKDAYASGVQSQAYLVSLLTSQRDDARIARDNATTRCAEFERRYNNLMEQLRKGGST